MTALISAIIFLGIIFGHYAIKCILNYNLFKKVGWIIAPHRERNLPSRDITSLLNTIIYKQQDLEISHVFWINTSDNIYIEEILEVFKKDISELYFGGFLSNTQKIRNLHADSYFMYQLFVFCGNYSEHDNPKLSDKIYKYESKDDSYHTYGLTDYGISFYKLYLISLLYVEKNPDTRKLYQYIDPKLKEHLKTYLNTKKVVFWRYRP